MFMIQWKRLLTDSKMSVDWGISGSSSKVLSISVRDMLSSLRVSETLSQSEVDHVDVVLLFADTDQEVVRLDVSVQEVAGMNELNSL